MKFTITLTGIFICICYMAPGQAKARKFATNINHPAINNFGPYLSLDGNSMIYLADVAEDNAITMNYTTRDGVNWKDPVVLPKSVNNRLNFMKGYALSPDGKTLYLTNMKSNGMGGFDIYASQLKGSLWGEPVNMLLPVNSKSHDACPSISLDGTTMFFMRCETMDFAKAEGCKLMMMKQRSNGRWDEPVELPGHINTGNSQTPRIMGDGEFLVFSSDRFQPNKGGMDLYYTRLIHGTWTRAEPLDFANSLGDDQYVSGNASGMYLVKDVKGQHSSELVELLFPPELRPKGTLKIEGFVNGPADPSSAFVTVFDLSDQGRVFSTRPGDDGAFAVYMNYGGVYDLSIEPEKDNYTFFSKVFDLQGENLSMVDKVQATLSPTVTGTELVLDGASFVPGTSVLTKSSNQELRRLLRMVQGNSGHAFSIEVTLKGYEIDSIQSTPDLTEVLVDTLRIPVTYMVDSTTTATRDSLVVTTRYHNDRTLGQAKAIETYLIQEGIQSSRLASSGIAELEALPEKRKTLIKIIVH